MKFKILLLFCFTSMVTFYSFAKDGDKGKPTLTIKFSFTGIVDSCDYVNRIKVLINNDLISTSPEKKQSESNSISINLKKGKYRLKIVDEVFFRGRWEEQTIANDYNIDAIYECDIDINENLTINLLFDLDKGVSIIP